MPFLMIRNDITNVAADAIVNPANRNLLQGSGTSRAIYQAAGEQELTAACEAIGYCEPGRAVCTPAFGLPAKYIFHAVCPAWHGGFFGEAEQLASAYHSALELAAEYHCESVAFPQRQALVKIPGAIRPGCQCRHRRSFRTGAQSFLRYAKAYSCRRLRSNLHGQHLRQPRRYPY